MVLELVKDLWLYMATEMFNNLMFCETDSYYKLLLGIFFKTVPL